MRLPRNFRTMEPLEERDLTINFADYIASSLTIVDIDWGLDVDQTLVNSEVDPDPQNSLIGDAVVFGHRTTQRIGNLMAGNDYIVRVQAILDNGETAKLWTVLPCREAG